MTAERIVLRLVAVAIIGLGIYICFRAYIVSQKIASFYSNYPLVRYAGEKQLTSRPVFVRIIGLVIALVGIICLLSV